MLSRKNEHNFFFEGEILNQLDEYTAPCILFPEEEKEWEKLKQYLRNNSLTVLCTFYGWDNFLNQIILTGNVYKFINYLENFVKMFPSKIYHLTDSGDLRIATIIQ